MKGLIIVESPAKAATIKKYLDGEYEVEASAGHIKDLPERALGVDVAKDFEPRFEVVKGKKKIVDRLRLGTASDIRFITPVASVVPGSKVVRHEPYSRPTLSILAHWFLDLLRPWYILRQPVHYSG